MRYARDWSHLAVSLCCAASAQLYAQTSGKTNEVVVSYTTSALTLERSERSDAFLDRFFDEVINSDSTVFDRYAGPSSQLGAVRKQNLFGYASLDRFNADGAGMFATIALDSLRTAIADALPLEQWQDQWQGRLAGLVAGTIGNPQEEHIAITSSSFSAVRLDWERENDRGGIQWGVRPWRTNPHLYFLAHAGRLDGWPLITFEGRAGYGVLSSALVEARLTLQLPASFQIAGGVSIDPLRVGAHETEATHISFTVQRVVTSRRPSSPTVVYAGFRSDVNRMSSVSRPETMLVAGLSKRF